MGSTRTRRGREVVEMTDPKKSSVISTSAKSSVPEFVTCPDCDAEQADMGQGTNCETCGYGPMPYYDEEGNLHD